MIQVRYEMQRMQYHIKSDNGSDLDFYLDEIEAERLVQQLIKHGLEVKLPHDNNYQAGELKAVKEHLADMRRLVLLENKDGDV
jgi:hypothetical protein